MSLQGGQCHPCHQGPQVGESRQTSGQHPEWLTDLGGDDDQRSGEPVRKAGAAFHQTMIVKAVGDSIPDTLL